MIVVTLTTPIGRLPPGRARACYERLLAETGGEMLGVHVPYYAEAPLWLAGGLPQAEALTARGVPRWRVWTLAELNSLLGACHGSPVHTLRQAAMVLQSSHA